MLYSCPNHELTREMIIQIFCCFLPISEFHRKRISNGVQTEWNLRPRVFWNKCDPEDLDPTSRHQPGRNEVGGHTYPPGAPSTLVGPMLLHRRTPSSYIYLRTPNYQIQSQNPNSTAVTFCIHEIPSWGLFQSSVGGGFYHGGLLHQHHSLSDEVWVVYFRPSGP